MFKFKNDNRGLVKWIFLIVIAIIILSYFGFDLRAIVEDDGTQDNIGYVWGGVVHVWEGYIKEPFDYLWNDIFIDLIWDVAVENLKRIKDGGPVYESS